MSKDGLEGAIRSWKEEANACHKWASITNHCAFPQEFVHQQARALPTWSVKQQTSNSSTREHSSASTRFFHKSASISRSRILPQSVRSSDSTDPFQKSASFSKLWVLSSRPYLVSRPSIVSSVGFEDAALPWAATVALWSLNRQSRRSSNLLSQDQVQSWLLHLPRRLKSPLGGVSLSRGSKSRGGNPWSKPAWHCHLALTVENSDFKQNDGPCPSSSRSAGETLPKSSLRPTEEIDESLEKNSSRMQEK